MSGPPDKPRRSGRKKKVKPNQPESVDDESTPTPQLAEEALPEVTPASASDSDFGNDEYLSGNADSGEKQSVGIPADKDPNHEYLAFTVGKEEYAVDILSIKEIIRPVEVTWVPRLSGNILGIISLRGTVLPIFDLKKKLGLSDGAVGRQARIVVVSIGNTWMGLFVDGVTDVIRVRPSSIEPPPATIGGGDAEYIKGVTRIKERLVIFLDIEKVLWPEVAADVDA